MKNISAFLFENIVTDESIGYYKLKKLASQCQRIPKVVLKCQFQSITDKKCQMSSNGSKVASVTHDLLPLYTDLLEWFNLKEIKK